MRIVAIGWRLGLLAKAKFNLFGLIRIDFDGPVFTGGHFIDQRIVHLLVRAVAKRLRLRVAAGAPEIVFPRFEFNLDERIACGFTCHAANLPPWSSVSSVAAAAF